MSEEKKVKAVLVELFQNDHKDKDGNVVKGETRRYWYQAEQYPVEVLDYGKYWEACECSCLWPATPDGVTVLPDTGTVYEWLELGGTDDIIDEGLKLEPGQWVEREFPDWCRTGCRVRVTAHGELPPLSAEHTVRASDLSDKAKTRIRVNGKPLYAYGTMKDGDCAWFPDFYDFVTKAVVDRVQEKGGQTAEVTLGSQSMTLRSDSAALTFDLKAKSREGLVEFLRNLGVANPETVKVTKTVGDASGIVCVFTLFNVGNII